MPNKSSKTTVKSIRIPNEVIEELAATAQVRGRSFNEEAIARIKAGADPNWRRSEVDGQASIFDAIEV